MTLPTFSHIAIDNAPGEFRAALISTEGRPWKLFMQRWNGAFDMARYGDVLAARMRKRAEEQGGAFIELVTGEPAFIRLKTGSRTTEGAALTVRVLSEAHGDKLARVEETPAQVGRADAFSQWRGEIPDGEGIPLRDDRIAVDDAFEEAGRSAVTIRGGGRMHIGRTRALTAFDVDTAGRISKGSAGARALSVNSDAVCEMVRQVSLRDLGGLLVLDCIGPLNRNAGEKLRTLARDTFRAVGVQSAQVLLPSPLGLLESAVAWRRRPIDERIADGEGESRLLALLREARREAEARPGIMFEISLAPETFAAFRSRETELTLELLSHFAGRLSVVESDKAKDEVRRK